MIQKQDDGSFIGYVQSWLSNGDQVCDVIPCNRGGALSESRSWLPRTSPQPMLSYTPTVNTRNTVSAKEPRMPQPVSPRELEAKKKELEEDLQRDLARLAEERKEGLHRIDWQLAEAVEALHAETVQRAKDRIRQHKEVMAELERHQQRTQDLSPALEMRSTGDCSPTSSNSRSRHALLEGGSFSSSGGGSDDEEPGVWDQVLRFFQRASGTSRARGSSSGGIANRSVDCINGTSTSRRHARSGSPPMGMTWSQGASPVHLGPRAPPHYSPGTLRPSAQMPPRGPQYMRCNSNNIKMQRGPSRQATPKGTTAAGYHGKSPVRRIEAPGRASPVSPLSTGNLSRQSLPIGTPTASTRGLLQSRTPPVMTTPPKPKPPAPPPAPHPFPQDQLSVSQ